MYNFNLCELLRDELIRHGIKCDYTHGETKWHWFYVNDNTKVNGSVEVYNNVAVYVNAYDGVKQIELNANDPDLICKVVKMFDLV